MRFFSHSTTNADGEVIGSKLMREHLRGVLSNALIHFSKEVKLGLSSTELEDLLKIIVGFHDLGKYTAFFQNYLLKRGPVDVDKKRHPPIGAFAAFNLLKEKDEKQALLALLVIFLHHGNLIDLTSFSERLSGHLENIINCQKDDLKKNISDIEKDLLLPDMEKYVGYPDERLIRKGFKYWAIRNSTISDYYLVNYLFSLLIESDKLDASNTSPYKLRAINDDCVDKRFGIAKPHQELNDLGNMTNNELRTFCRAEVISNLKDENVLTYHVFTLTAPTGIGKTMTALDFALKLKAKIKESLDIEARVIYALPFINIIEQALNEYKKTLPGEVNVLAHYQYADLFGKDDKQYSEHENGTVRGYNQKVMSLETWQADIVITSFVQFFETLIGNRNKLLKKFSHYANAIIILDEVQTLRLDQMPLIGAALYYLSKFMNSRLILMTATKPKIFELAQRHILQNEGETILVKELLRNHEKVFAVFERTRIVPLLNIEFNNPEVEDVFINDVFSKKWSPKKSCIIVCNTVNRSIEIIYAIKSFLIEQNYENPVEYLSTNIIPAERFERIKRIKQLLDDGKSPILVSTQVVEAGVDLDFDMGFRDLGPIDSIIQVAGRINRNNNLQKKLSPLYIVDFGDCQKIYHALTTNQARSALSEQKEFIEPEYLKLIGNYFDRISDKSSFDQYLKIFDSMKVLRYDSEDNSKMPVSSFRIIEESRSTKAVFIEFGEYEQKLNSFYLAKIKHELPKEDFDKYYKSDFQQRIITVPAYYTNGLEKINEFEDNILIVPKRLISTYYDLETGFIRKHQTTKSYFL
jgi:CRISPR-associated endonuclease/helicase Cas3